MMNKTKTVTATVPAADTNENTMFNNMISELENMKKSIGHMVSSLKMSQKHFTKKTKSPNIKSGFVKPVRLSKELSTLIGTGEDELVPRNIVNRKINEYVKTHDLQIPESRQNFRVDDDLGKLFKLEPGTTVHYFKMQTYLKCHYPKQDKPKVVVEDVVPASVVPVEDVAVEDVPASVVPVEDVPVEDVPDDVPVEDVL
jgi:chromatin remodeling complex protein RSC6